MAFLKVLHLLSIIIWLGSLLPLTWMVAYLKKQEESIHKHSLQMWRRFYFLVDRPAMVFALGTGLFLFLGKKVFMAQGWLHMKLTLVFLLVVIDLVVGRLLAKSQKKGLVRGFALLHGGTLLFLAGILFSVYILKNK